MIERNPSSYILWLASWYPNKQEPFEGDFIQRHAYAVSSVIPIVVIHVLQYGEKSIINEDRVEINESGNLKEISISFRFLKTGINILDKILFNFKYYSTYKKNLKNFFKETGRPDLVHVHIPMKAGMIAKWVKRKWILPYVVSEHASTYEKAAPDFFKKRSFIYRRSVYQVFKKADVITNVSFKMGKRVTELLQLDKETEVISNVVDESLFFYSSNKPQIFTFIHVSSLIGQKNIEAMLTAFQSLKTIRNDWHLLIVGPADSQLKTYATLLGLNEKITFTGEVPYHEVPKYMQQSSALVLFSRHENLPCVILEALCCGIPIISSDVGAISEVVNDSTGILVPSEDREKLLSALQTMMDNYSNYNRERISKEAVTKYNRKVIAEKFKLLYEKVASTHPSSSNSSS